VTAFASEHGCDVGAAATMAVDGRWPCGVGKVPVRCFAYQESAGGWRLIHHHGSIDDPRQLSRYQNAVASRQPRPSLNLRHAASTQGADKTTPSATATTVTNVAADGLPGTVRAAA
jgi:hypothetical protein